MPLGAFVFTTNVDGQFQKAGFDDRRVHEHHGSIHRLQCLKPCTGDTWTADELLTNIDDTTCLWRGDPPHCPRCGGIARPNILMFSDSYWLDAKFEAQAQRLSEWLLTVRRPVVVEIGAGTAIPSVRRFSDQVIRDRGGRLVRINPREAEVPTPWDIGLRSGALNALRVIERALELI
jgi:NAD-dependent SIR2 family protein deacetylase